MKSYEIIICFNNGEEQDELEPFVSMIKHDVDNDKIVVWNGYCQYEYDIKTIEKIIFKEGEK